MTSAARPVDLAELAARATAAAQDWYPDGRVEGIRELHGGQSSLTFTATVEPSDRSRGQRAVDIVLKVAPPGLEPVRNRDVLRQARLLRSLRAVVPQFKVPAVHFEDGGAPPATPPFFAMQRVRGRSFEPHLDPDDEDVAPDAIEARAREAARLLALLHAQNADLVGAFGEPVVGVAAEVDRWERAFATVTDIAAAADAAGAVAALRATMPADLPSCVVHGDYRLGNMLAEGPTVNAVIDWEIWGRGDPRVDVAWFLLCSEPHKHPTAVRVRDGMPAADELLAEYRQAGGRDLPDLAWFEALALTKMAATTALIAKHNRKMGAVEVGERTAATVPGMLTRALAAL